MGERGESEKQRVDRELIELLNELRVALPGVQVLFAFMLTVPFSQGFRRLTEVQRDFYFVAFLLAAAASIFLIAPSAHHRIRFRAKDKQRMLFMANRLAIVGTIFLMLAMSFVVFVISDVLFGVTWAATIAGITAGAFIAVWYVIPLYWRFTSRGEEGWRRHT